MSFSRISVVKLPDDVEYAVYGHYPEVNTPARPGWNRRLFNRIDSASNNNLNNPIFSDPTQTDQDDQTSGEGSENAGRLGSIRLDNSTGELWLEGGSYMVSGVSLVLYMDMNHKSHPVPDMPAGYCELRGYTSQTEEKSRDESETVESNQESSRETTQPVSRLLATGTLARPTTGAPSLFEAAITVERGTRMRIYVEHYLDSGSEEGSKDVENFWLGLDETGTHNHVFARISVHKIE